MNIKSAIPALTFALTASCGGTAMSPAKLAASEGSVRGAEEVGAREVPKASLHLKLARDQLAKAKVLSENGDGEVADRMLTRAEVDADLAIALAKEASARSEAEAVMAEVATARKEIP